MSPAISPSTRPFHSSVNSRRSMFTTGLCFNKGSIFLWASTDPGKNIKLDSESTMETSGWDWRRFTRWRTALHTNWGWNSCWRTVRGIQWNTTHSVWRVKPRTTRYTWLDTREMCMTSWTMERSRVGFITGWTSQHTIVTMIATVDAIVLPCMQEDGGTTTAVHINLNGPYGSYGFHVYDLGRLFRVSNDDEESVRHQRRWSCLLISNMEDMHASLHYIQCFASISKSRAMIQWTRTLLI